MKEQVHHLRGLTLPLLSCLLLLLSACSDSVSMDDNGNGNPPPGEFDPDAYVLENAFPGLSFNRPVLLTDAGDGSGRLFVVEQRGTIRVFENDPGTSSSRLFLDLRGKVDDSGGEEGLLGLAFHPDYTSNGYFYVNYTAASPARSVNSRFTVSSDPDVANPSSELEILSYAQPFSNHNGGQLTFGPDGLLYIALGDGGSGGDPRGNGQDRTTLLGSILRIDVDGAEEGRNYAIASRNPFVGNEQGYREEIYAWGLRNPWRFSFDAETGRLIAGDVGQSRYEEIDLIESGGNYGWNIMEGNHCYGSQNCDQAGLTPPIWEYAHNGGNGSVTGGYVYRGEDLPALEGYYIYADFISGRIWALDLSDSDNPENHLLIDSDLNISSFGVDADNELYICAFDGSIYRLRHR
ncbi:MAG: PQQ-dependent sugar dehydrogenase [Balneolaceae bacterium]|nr:PQQ-dependent sugar dehydrogenase [Balneolaceae bacterium]